MKTLLFASIMLISSNLMAATTLICNDQNSRAVYKLTLNDNATKLNFEAIAKDNSLLSSSAASLRYNEGESNSAIALYEGVNLKNDTIIVEIDKKTVAQNSTAELTVYYAASTSTILNNKTTFLCELK